MFMQLKVATSELTSLPVCAVVVCKAANNINDTIFRGNIHDVDLPCILNECTITSSECQNSCLCNRTD